VDRTHPLAGLLPTLVREAHPVRLEPRPLGDRAVDELVQHSYPLPAADAHRLVTFLQARAEGNPFFLHELLWALEQEQHLRPVPAGWQLGELAGVGLPRLLLQVLERRLTGLSRRAQEALATAAVIGHVVPQSLWATVGDLDEADRLACLDELVTARLLVETSDGASVRFSHALVRQALYDGLLPLLRLSRRRSLHRRVAEVLSATPEADPDAVAYHFQCGGDPRAVEWLLRAGGRAEGALAWLTAAQRYTAALTLLDTAGAASADRAVLRYRLALLRQYEDAPGAQRLLGEAVRLATEAGARRLVAMARFHQGAAAAYGGEVGSGVAQMEAALASLEALESGADVGDEGPLASLLFRASDHNPRGMLAGWLALIGRLRDASAMGAAPFVLGANATWDAAAPTHQGVHAPYNDAFTGQLGAARRGFVALRAELQAAGDQFMAAVVQSNELIWVGLPYAADDLPERRRLATATDDVLSLASGVYDEVPSLWLRLPLLVLDGDWTAARRVAELAVAMRGGSQHIAVPILATLARDQGEPDKAWALVHQTLAQGPATPPGTTFFMGTLILQRLAAALALDVGDLVTARVWLEANDHLLAWSGATLGVADAQLAWATYYRRAGKRARAEECARRGLALARDPRQPLALLAAKRLLGELAMDSGRLGEAAALLDKSLALADACAAPFERALTLLAQAEAAVLGGRRSAAQGLLDEVRTIGSVLGASLLLTRAAALSSSSARTGRLGTAYPAGLSAREAEILRLIAAGLSNDEIGARLSLSLSTVKNHVAHVLTKTECRNRAAAAVFAQREGLI
jgi:DNA-binding CsgD family transcriptional regulator/tetratricopeptide (TPR) repeat protein